MDTNFLLARFRFSKLWLIAVLFCLIGIMSFLFLPEGVDFNLCFRPAAMSFLSGRSPYEVSCFFNAPWALLPLIPFAILPEKIGSALLLATSFVTYSFVAARLGGKPLAVALFLLSPPVVHGLLNGNLEWLTMLGFILPRPIGIFFLAIKPQISVALAIFWVTDDWRSGGWRKVLKNYWPFASVLLLSFATFDLWPLRFGVSFDSSWAANASLWPMSIPIGLGLLVASIHKRNAKLAMAASPCFSPYLKLHSWSVSLLAMVGQTPEMIAAVVGSWILVAIRAIGK